MSNQRLERAAKRVTESPAIQSTIELTFITPDGNVKTHRALEFFSSADFVTKFTTDFDVTLMLSMADFRYKVYPHRDNLDLLVQWFPIDATGNKKLSPKPLYSETYRALLFDNDDGATEGGSAVTSKRQQSAQDEQRIIKVSLVEKPTEAVAYKSAQGTFRNTDNYNLLTGYLAAVMKEEESKNPHAKILFEVSPIDTSVVKRDAITIPIETRLVDVPEFLQTREGGLYSQGLMTFIQRNIWWIGPIFDTSRFTTTTRRMKIIQLAGNYPPVNESTWRLDNQELTVLCTGASKLQDISSPAQINHGVGVRFLKATEMFENTTQGDPNKEHFNQEGTLAEFQVGEREDGNNIAMFSDNKITDNVANEYSKIAFRKGQLFITVWQRSQARHVYPGMPMRLYYDRDGQTVVYDGVVLQIDEQTVPEQKGMQQKNMISTSAITCFINKEVTRNG